MKVVLNIMFFIQVTISLVAGQSLNFFNMQDLNKIKVEYRENGEFKKEIETLQYLADLAIEKGPYTITKYTAPYAKDATINDYYSDSPYWWPIEGEPNLPYIRRDGERNPDRFMDHKNELSIFYKGILALTFYNYFSDNHLYEEKVNELLNIWFIEKSTRMNPNLKYSQLIRNRTRPRGVGIIDGRRLAVLTEAIILLKSQGRIKDYIYEGVKAWYTEYLDWLTTSIYGLDEKKRGNNHGTWWAVQISAISNFLQIDDNINFIDSHSKHFLLDNQIDAYARQPLEEERTRSLDYSVFNLTAHSYLNSTLLNYNINNWKYLNKNGKTLIEVIEFLIPFMEHPEDWEITQINNFDNSKPLFLGFAGIDLQNLEYLKLYNKLSYYEEKDLNKPTFDPMQIILDSVVKMKLTNN